MRAAVALLTRVPVGGFPYSDSDLRWSAAHLPLVGALVGALLAATWSVGVRAGNLVAAVVVVASSLLLTGAIHEDGLADTADALGGGTTRERVLAILKDSRIGAFGSAALTLAILLRVALLARLGAAAPVALVLTQAASRAAPVWLMASLPYVTDGAVAKSRSIAGAGRGQVLVATAWVAALCGGLCYVGAVGAVELGATWVAAAAVTLGCASCFRARAGGITGDFLGAAQQINECAILLVLALVRGGAP
jgi:adenosylcobinamide-GDP ribazoletransferase